MDQNSWSLRGGLLVWGDYRIWNQAESSKPSLMLLCAFGKNYCLNFDVSSLPKKKQWFFCYRLLWGFSREMNVTCLAPTRFPTNANLFGNQWAPTYLHLYSQSLSIFLSINHVALVEAGMSPEMRRSGGVCMTRRVVEQNLLSTCRVFWNLVSFFSFKNFNSFYLNRFSKLVQNVTDDCFTVWEHLTWCYFLVPAFYFIR